MSLQIALFCSGCQSEMEYCPKRQRAVCRSASCGGSASGRAAATGKTGSKTAAKPRVKEYVTPAQQAIIDAHPPEKRPRFSGGLGILKPEEIPEHTIQSQILRGLHAAGWLVVRMNSGGAKMGSDYVKFYRVFALAEKVASAGLPDILAFKNSRFLMVEVKDRTGKLRPSQARFIECAQRFGVKVHVARSWDAVQTVLDELAAREANKPTRAQWGRLLRIERLARAQWGAELDEMLDAFDGEEIE